MRPGRMLKKNLTPRNRVRNHSGRQRNYVPDYSHQQHAKESQDNRPRVTPQIRHQPAQILLRRTWHAIFLPFVTHFSCDLIVESVDDSPKKCSYVRSSDWYRLVFGFQRTAIGSTCLSSIPLTGVK